MVGEDLYSHQVQLSSNTPRGPRKRSNPRDIQYATLHPGSQTLLPLNLEPQVQQQKDMRELMHGTRLSLAKSEV